MRAKTQGIAKRIVLALAVMACVLCAGMTAWAADAGGGSTPITAPGIVPGLPYADINQNEHVNLFSGLLTISLPIGPPLKVGPNLSFQAHLIYVGLGSGNTDSGNAYRNASYAWTVFYGRVHVHNPEDSYFEDELGGQHQIIPKSGSTTEWVAVDGSGIRIFNLGNGFRLDLRNGNHLFATLGNSSNYFINHVTDPFGNGFCLQYDSSVRVINISDDSNSSRYIQFTYNTAASSCSLTKIDVPPLCQYT